MRVVDIVGEAPVAHGLVRARSSVDYVGRQLNRVGLDPDADAPLSAPVLGRPAGADRHRARARGQAGVPRVRRIGGRARRVDPGAGAEPVHRPARGAQSHLSLHQPRPRRRRAHQRPGRDHVPRPRRRNRPRPTSSSPHRIIRTRRRCLRRSGKVEPKKRTFVPIKGEIPSPLDPPPGCHFHPRCPYAMPKCSDVAPALIEIAPGRRSACHLNEAH